MTIGAKRKTLDAHSVPHYTENDRLYADSMINGTAMFEEVKDITDWSARELYSWLGY